MAFIDRIVQHPGRVKLTAVDGEADTYDITRAEGDVTEEGTPLNAENLNREISAAASGAVEAFDIDNSQNVHYRNLQAGFITTKANANVATKRTITFKEPFTTPPVVVCSLAENSPATGSVTVHNVTTTGFDLYIYRTGAYTTRVYWIATI